VKRSVFSPIARRDVARAWEYIAADNVSAANRFIDKLEYALELLVKMPTLGHMRKEVTDSRYRFWAVRPYIIAYRYNTRTLTVVRLIHGARDFRGFFR
jgi:plasmid stabilization system protein ParE